MPRVEYWHSTGQRVYHSCTRCPVGSSILPHHRYLGTGDKRPCSECALLIQRGGC